MFGRNFPGERVDRHRSEMKSAYLRLDWYVRFSLHAHTISAHCLYLLFVLLCSSICKGVKWPRHDPVEAICDCHIVCATAMCVCVSVIHDAIVFPSCDTNAARLLLTTKMLMMMTQFLHSVKYDFEAELSPSCAVDTFARIFFSAKNNNLSCHIMRERCLGTTTIIIIITSSTHSGSWRCDKATTAATPMSLLARVLKCHCALKFDLVGMTAVPPLRSHSSRKVADLLTSACQWVRCCRLTSFPPHKSNLTNMLFRHRKMGSESLSILDPGPKAKIHFND